MGVQRWHLQLARIGLVCKGDASRSETAFPRTAKKISESIRKQEHHVIPIDASLRGASRFE